MDPAHSAAISARPANLAFGVVMDFLPVEVAPEYIASGVEFTNGDAPGVRLRKG